MKIIFFVISILSGVIPASMGYFFTDAAYWGIAAPIIAIAQIFIFMDQT